MQDDLVELVEREEPVAAHGGVLRGDRLQRPAAEVAGEDDVDDVLRGRSSRGRDRVDDRDRPLERHVVDPDLLGELARERVDEALARVDAPAREQPVLLARLLVAAEQDPVLPAQQRRDADARLAAHVPDEPKPAAALARGSSSTSTQLDSRDRHDDELGDPHPRLDDEAGPPVRVVKNDTKLASIAGVDEPGRVHDRDPVLGGEARTAA